MNFFKRGYVSVLTKLGMYKFAGPPVPGVPKTQVPAPVPAGAPAAPTAPPAQPDYSSLFNQPLIPQGRVADPTKNVALAKPTGNILQRPDVPIPDDLPPQMNLPNKQVAPPAQETMAGGGAVKRLGNTAADMAAAEKEVANTVVNRRPVPPLPPKTGAFKAWTTYQRR